MPKGGQEASFISKTEFCLFVESVLGVQEFNGDVELNGTGIHGCSVNFSEAADADAVSHLVSAVMSGRRRHVPAHSQR